MFCLTHKERKILLFVGVLILLGSLLRFFKVGLKEPTFKEVISHPLIVNINAASKEELESIPGIGKVTARKIIEYRSRYGQFRGLEDLKKVKGIGDKKIEVIKRYIAF